MPKVDVKRDLLFAELGQTFSKYMIRFDFDITLTTSKNSNWYIFSFKAQEEFELLCFEFGVELDDVVSRIN